MKNRNNQIGNKNIIGARITRIRKSQGMTQKELQQKLQACGRVLSVRTLSRIERQHIFAYDYDIVAFSEALDVDIDELIF